MADAADLRITYLPPEPAVALLVAEWQWREWPYGSSLEDRKQRLLAAREQQTVPCCLVAWRGDLPVGSAALVEDDMPIRPDWSPWLASVVVEPHLRGQGIGQALCREAVNVAARQGVKRLYLHTPDQERFYTRLGWHTLETAHYRGLDVLVMAIDL